MDENASCEVALEFRWGTPDVFASEKHNYYRSFFHKNEEYFLYDCVYVNGGNSVAPYIGKIMRMWEVKETGARRLRIRWFFRPDDIPDAIAALIKKPDKKELFIGAGKGQGAENFNPLEAVTGKCRIVCCAPDAENPQPKEEELEAADFFFYRSFDVDTHAVNPDLKKVVEEVGAIKLFGRTALPTHQSTSNTTIAAEVERKPNPETKKRNIFRKFTWEEQLEHCYHNGLVVELENFDPALTTKDLEEVFAALFSDVRCEISVTSKACLPPRSANLSDGSILASGQAFVCFMVKEQGKRVLKTLQEKLLILTEDGRPLVANAVEKPTKKSARFPGHINLDELKKHRHYDNDKMRSAVSTSHCVQPNTIEFEMALKWRVLQEEHKMQWGALHRVGFMIWYWHDGVIGLWTRYSNIIIPMSPCSLVE